MNTAFTRTALSTAAAGLAAIVALFGMLAIVAADDAARAARVARYAETGGITAELDGACVRAADARPSYASRIEARAVCCEAREARIPALFRAPRACR